jgi:hypothetical protein
MAGLGLDIPEQKMTWKEAYDFGWTLANRVKYISLVSEGISKVGQENVYRLALTN